MAETWRNWSGRQEASAQKLAFVRSAADAEALVRETAARGGRIRAAGAGHSHQPLAVCEDTIVDISGLAGIQSVDQRTAQAWIGAGTPIYALGAALHAAGLALKNQGDIDRQTLAGAISTGTHGTGEGLQNISASVTGLQLVTAKNGLVECSAGEGAELVNGVGSGVQVKAAQESSTGERAERLHGVGGRVKASAAKESSAGEGTEFFHAARLGLGAVGLITAVRMQLRPACVLKESGFAASYAELVPRLEELATVNERFEFFWFPQRDEAQVKLINPTDEPPVYPLAAEGSRQAYSHEVLPSHRPHLHTEMEYSVPRAAGAECFAEIRQLLQSRFKEVAWPVEYRTVAADDLWLSMAFARPTVTISVHQDVRQDETAYFQACEAIFKRHQGRPHWGKVNYLGAADFPALYPNWQRWWQARNAQDPEGIFLNTYLSSLVP